jgi:membrane associated rhomboid family serine protease
MIPLRDNLPTRRPPIVTLLLIGVNGYVFLKAFLQGPWAAQRFISYYGLIPCGLTGHCVITGRAFSPEVSLFTSMFVHAGFFHLAGNMLYLWIFGNNVEDAMGKVRFVSFYLLCGVGSACIQILVNPASHVPMVGASGAISGILGAYVVLFPHARILTLIPLGLLFPILEIRAVFVIGFWIVVQVLNGLLTFNYEGGGVAWFAHVGGFAVGLALVPFFRRKSPSRAWRKL